MPKEREDVEATLQHDTTPDTSQKKTWRAIDWITGITFVAEVVWGAIWLVTQVFHWCSWNPPGNAEYFFAQFYCGVGLGILSFGYLTLILWPIIFNILLKILKMLRIFKQDKDSKQGNDPRWFHARILSSGIVGGSYAFLLPAVMSLEEGSLTSGGATALRQAILLATGGLIGLIALGETRRKNDNDREAAENLRIHQQDTLDQQKDQFDANAFKERKAERRERYTKAVEQLGSQEPPIRMGGVYTLVGLVDEWLEEESIRKYEDRLKEGQVIINNLCAYIRSPFTLDARYDELSEDNPSSDGIYKDNQQKFYADKAEFKAEADVRLGIIKEIHDRLQGPEEKTPGIWSYFEYDLSGSTFFYLVNLTGSYYKKILRSVALLTRVRLTSVALLTRVRLTSVAPPTRVRLTSVAPPTRRRLTSVAPPTRRRLASTAPLTKKVLTSAIPPTGVRLTSVALLTRVRLTSVAPLMRKTLLSVLTLTPMTASPPM